MGLTPEKVVGAAAHLADQVGFAGLSLAGVAANLGVRVPSLYKHVGGLDDLQRRLAAQGSQGLAAAVEAAVHGTTGRSALAAVAGAYHGYVRDNRGCYEAMVRFGGDDHRRRFTRVDLVLRQIAASYGMSADDARTAAMAIHSALHGFVLLDIDGAVGNDPDQSRHSLVSLLDQGLSASTQSRPRFRLGVPGRVDPAPRPR